MAAQDSEELVEELSNEILVKIDKETLRLGLNLYDAAEVCRDIAKLLNERARQMDHEAGSEDEDDEEDSEDDEY